MSNDDDVPPVAFDPAIEAVLKRGRQLLDAKEAPKDTGKAQPGAMMGTLEEHAHEIWAERDGRARVALEVMSGPSAEVLHEKWGIVHEDALLIRGLSRTTAFRETHAIRCAREFLAEASAGVVKIMVQSGSRGVGKTIAGAWTMLVARPDLGGKSWPTERHPVMISASTIAMWGSYGFVAERDRIARCKVLVIDELGIEDSTRGFGPYLNELVNQRAGAAGYTVITCNLSVPEFAAKYGSRIMDRLRQRGAWFEIDHPSLRNRYP